MTGMFTLVYGGSASGKSAFAEQLVCLLEGKRIYIATMEPWGEESRRRIARHQQMRSGKGFETIECYCHGAELSLPAGSNVLLECMGNLLANEKFREDGGGVQAVREAVRHLKQNALHLTIVTNEVFSSGFAYSALTLEYMKELAMLNREMAREADQVAEVVCGLVNWLKKAPGN